jgi:hypothetical protein
MQFCAFFAAVALLVDGNPAYASEYYQHDFKTGSSGSGWTTWAPFPDTTQDLGIKCRITLASGRTDGWAHGDYWIVSALYNNTWIPTTPVNYRADRNIYFEMTSDGAAGTWKYQVTIVHVQYQPDGSFFGLKTETPIISANVQLAQGASWVQYLAFVGETPSKDCYLHYKIQRLTSTGQPYGAPLQGHLNPVQ